MKNIILKQLKYKQIALDVAKIHPSTFLRVCGLKLVKPQIMDDIWSPYPQLEDVLTNVKN